MAGKTKARAGCNRASLNKTHTKIIRFRFDNRTTCACCGIRFQPLQPSHRLCRDCWNWCCIGQHVEEMSRLLREVVP